MKNSSNKDMKQVFGHLANIKTAEPNANLYAKTVGKIQRQNVIPMFWVRAVACLLVAFISTEFYFTFRIQFYLIFKIRIPCLNFSSKK